MSRFRLSMIGPRLGFLVTLGLMLGACQVVEPAAGAAPAALEQWSGLRSGVTVTSHRVLRDATAWNAFWQDVEMPAPRAFNPAREQAVAVFIGERRTGGYTVRVESAGPRAGRLVVTYRESRPPRGTLVAQEITSPWALVMVARTELPVEIQADEPSVPSPAKK